MSLEAKKMPSRYSHLLCTSTHASKTALSLAYSTSVKVFAIGRRGCFSSPQSADACCECKMVIDKISTAIVDWTFTTGSLLCWQVLDVGRNPFEEFFP